MSHDARPTANHAYDEAVLPPFPTVPSLKRTAGTLDDMTNKMMKDDVVEMQGNDRVSDGRHHQPPPEKRMRSNTNPLPSRVPPATATVQQSAQPSSIAIIAAPTASGGGPSEYLPTLRRGYHGVHWDSSNHKYMARIWHNKKDIYVGSSADAKEAAFMRDRAWRDLGKNPSKLNFDDTVPIPNEYLASVAKASKQVASCAAGVPLPPPPLEQIAQPSSIAIDATPTASGGGPSEYLPTLRRGYHGVCWNSSQKKYTAYVKHNRKSLYVGASADAKEAAFMRDRAWRDLGLDPSKHALVLGLNFDDTVPIPNEYLASVAKVSKKFESLAAAVPPLPPPPPPLEQIAQPSSLDAVQGLEALAIEAPSAENEDGGVPLQAAEYENEVPPAAASSPTTTIINHNYNIHSGASATFHINYNNSSPAAAGIPNNTHHHHFAQSPPPPSAE